MAIGIYRKVRVKEGCGERFEALLRGYVADVVSSEPGCTFLAFLRSPTDSQLFSIHEEYADEYALEQHRNSDLERLWLPVLVRQVASITASRFSVADADELISLS
ncbi:MAG TPA: antibiotic biosynthesis monooxygenase family protein [Hyphomicrobiaceae bacterium]|nr:antibiotic biosynthesis monooxygenase family protein [Hyphomicrobiaceae bacterium]